MGHWAGGERCPCQDPRAHFGVRRATSEAPKGPSSAALAAPPFLAPAFLAAQAVATRREGGAGFE
eukprot:4402965-Pyramimonas_sp.AAC.1